MKDTYDNPFDYFSLFLYEAWLSDPTHIGPSAQVVWPIVGQEILNGDVGGGFRGIEQTLNKTIPEDSQASEYLFQKGLFDLIVPRNLLKSVLSELFKLHAFFPLNSNSMH